jgi:SpoVK/Ycf46/Vps4 family AAA+-type ATPase
MALFVGPPGTGKTQAARELAAEMGMQLERVDLAAVISKYIGKTEKNLDRIFQRAGDSEAILFFDEAGALFGRRTEVKNSSDRHAYMDADDLLESLEEYNGLVILTSNHKNQIDNALLNRIRFVVEFP